MTDAWRGSAASRPEPCPPAVRGAAGLRGEQLRSSFRREGPCRTMASGLESVRVERPRQGLVVLASVQACVAIPAAACGARELSRPGLAEGREHRERRGRAQGRARRCRPARQRAGRVVADREPTGDHLGQPLRRVVRRRTGHRFVLVPERVRKVTVGLPWLDDWGSWRERFSRSPRCAIR